LVSPLHLLVFGGSLLVYNTHRIVMQRYAKSRRRQASKYKVWYVVFFVLGLAMVAVSLPQLSWKMLAGCGVLGLFAFMYSLPLLPFKNIKRLREVGWLKITTLAGVWTIVTSILPILYLDKNIGDYPFEIALRLTFIFALCIVFDIRDAQKDIENDIQTLPNRVGLENSYRLINAMLITFSLLSVIQYARYPEPVRLIGALLTAVITRLVVSYLKNHPTDRAYLGLGDGVMLVYALLVILPTT
jgi:4-hydroxybenzoate polyprenyltransferase